MSAPVSGVRRSVRAFTALAIAAMSVWLAAAPQGAPAAAAKLRL